MPKDSRLRSGCDDCVDIEQARPGTYVLVLSSRSTDVVQVGGSAPYSFSRASMFMSAARLDREAAVPGLPTVLSSHAGLTGTSTTCERIRVLKKSGTVSTLGDWSISV